MKWSDEAVEASRLSLLRCSFGEAIPTNPQMRAALEAASAVADKERNDLAALETNND